MKTRWRKWMERRVILKTSFVWKLRQEMEVGEGIPDSNLSSDWRV